MFNSVVTLHMNRRNREVHSGDVPFDDLGSSTWLPNFYSVCKVLVAEIGESLETLLGESAAQEAEQHIVALEDKSAKAVAGTISDHKTIWDEKGKQEKENLSMQAETLCTRESGQRVDCSSCNSVSIIHGSSTGAPTIAVDEDGIIEKNTMLPSSFECIAYGLKISGYSKQVACGLGETYVSTIHYRAAEYFGINLEEEYHYMMDEDNNEPY